MIVIYTRHAEDKLKRTDIKKFKIRKKVIEDILRNPRSKTRTKSGDWAAVSAVDGRHDLNEIL